MTDTRREWTIGLEPWVMVDGHYGDFSVGDTTEFALEFWGGRTLAPTDQRRMQCEPLGGHRYRVVAPVVWTDGDFSMIDIGVQAYVLYPIEQTVPEAGWVAGEIRLDIDCFHYFQQWGPAGEVPPAIYTWRITGIREHSAPRPPDDGDYVDPDDLPWTVRDVERTRAWEIPEDRVVRYALVCELQDDPPRTRLARAW
jgi:hypothetical protein